jgi:PAS domain S-box-containing protein
VSGAPPPPAPGPAASGPPDPRAGWTALRQKAEVAARLETLLTLEQSEVVSPEALRSVLHEVRVHQLELQMQNEELLRTQAELARAKERYFDLYDLAPVGYCTVNAQGLILETNLTFATLLGRSRGELVQQPFTRFVCPEQADRYSALLLLRHTLATPASCALRLKGKQHARGWFWAELHATAGLDPDQASNLRIIVTDISRRKQAEHLLHEQDAFNAGVLDSVDDHIVVLDPQALILFGNRAWRRSFAPPDSPAPAAYPVGRNYLHLCAATTSFPQGAEAAAARAGLQAVLSGTQPSFQLEYACPAPPERRWFLMTVTPLVGPRPGVVVSHKDITARMLATAARRETEERFQTLVKNLHVGVLLHGPGTEILLANPRALELLGLTADQAPGRTAFDPTWDVIHADGSPFPGPTRPVAQALATARPVPAVVMGVYRRTTQDRVWLRVAAEPQLAGDGTVVHVLCTLEDISAQHGAETALQLSDFSVRQASLATLWVAPDARLRRVNRAACDLLGYTEAELLALRFTDLEADSSAERWSAHWRELRDLRQMSFEAQYRHKSGRLIAVDVELNWFEYEGQQYNVAFLRDLSATHTLEAQLRHSQKLEAIGTLAGGIAHDFNNILAAIYGFTALAQHAAADNPEVVDYLEEISRSGQRAAELVRQILAFSSPRNESTTMGPLRLDSIVAEALKLLRASAPTTIEIVAPPDRPAFPLVQGNASQLHQVVMNLATNAVHALGQAPGRLTIGLDVCSAADALAATVPGLQAGPCARLTVTDTGAGIDAATQARVFEPFFTTKAPGEGTGLGLSVADGIVRRHRGGIRLTSALGRGTTFEVFLPLAQTEAPPPPPAAPDVPRGQGERILLVDDEALIAYAGRIILTQFGYVAESETNSLAALARLERDPQAFDLVVSDQTMPHLTGLGLAQRLRALRPDLPVLLTSGHGHRLTPEALHAAGVQEVLAKPYTMEALALALHRHLPRKPAGDT